MNRQRLHSITRDSGFLWKSSLYLLLLFISIGALLWVFAPKAHSVSYEELYLISSDENFEIAINTAEYASILSLQLQGRSSFPEKLQAVKYLVHIGPSLGVNALPSRERLPGISDSEYEILQAFSDALRGSRSSQGMDAETRLLQLAEQSPPPPFANYAASLYYSTRGETENALRFAKLETLVHPSDHSRRYLVDLYNQHARYDELRELQTDANFTPFFDAYLRRDLALQTMDWPVLISTLLPLAYEDMSLSMVLLALLTGLAWGTLVLRFGGTLSLRSKTVQLALPALLLGAASAHLTILAIFFQEEQLGLQQGRDFVGQVIYCVAGIGLREELLKLLCFLPLLPFLLKRRNELEVLVVASLVGLGFAVEENISYLEYSQGMDAIGRFMTANFFHFALTGMCGLAVAQAILYGGSSISSAVSTFGLAVVAHGAYNAFIIVPELGEYSFASIIILILVAYQYFHWLRHLRVAWRDTISISAHFTFGLVIVFGVSFALVSWSYGPMEALFALGGEVLGLALLLVMFYREIPEEIG